MSDATNKQMPLIGNQSTSVLPSQEDVQNDPELMQAALTAHMNAVTGQRDEALAKAAELFAQLNVLEVVCTRLKKANAELQLDLNALKKAAGIPVDASAAPAS